MNNHRISKTLATGLVALLPFTSLGENSQEMESAGMYSTAGNFFLKSSNYTESAKSYDIAADLYFKEGKYTNSVNSYILSGTIATKAGDLKLAISQYKKALNLAKEKNVSINSAELHDTLGNLLLEYSENNK